MHRNVLKHKTVVVEYGAASYPEDTKVFSGIHSARVFVLFALKM